MRFIDLRSDTVTLPTPKMRYAMYKAEVGDDVYGEDKTVNRLEEMAAEMMGKEAALFVTSGTQGNQIAVLTHTNRGDEIIVEENSHIFCYEVGGLGFLAGVQTRTLKGDRGCFNTTELENSIRSENIHFPKTGLICLENTHNRYGGVVIPLDDMERIYNLSRKYGIPVHLDGARIFNAATYLKCEAKDIAKYADSVMFCLSKGLCAPVGSLLVGSKEFIARARKLRKMLGGGMRQAGILAAAGIVALTEMVDRLEEDHKNARILAEGLLNISGIKIDMESVQTNMVMADIEGLGMDADTFVNKLLEKGIKVNSRDRKTIRFVTHYYVTTEDIFTTLSVINSLTR